MTLFDYNGTTLVEIGRTQQMLLRKGIVKIEGNTRILKRQSSEHSCSCILKWIVRLMYKVESIKFLHYVKALPFIIEMVLT